MSVSPTASLSPCLFQVKGDVGAKDKEGREDNDGVDEGLNDREGDEVGRFERDGEDVGAFVGTEDVLGTEDGTGDSVGRNVGRTEGILVGDTEGLFVFIELSQMDRFRKEINSFETKNLGNS